MGTTLEQGKMLVDKFQVVDGVEAINLMRKRGVRRMNVNANTGQTKYAFNGFQHRLLPPCYRPPTGTYSGSVMS